MFNDGIKIVKYNDERRHTHYEWFDCMRKSCVILKDITIDVTNFEWKNVAIISWRILLILICWSLLYLCGGIQSLWLKLQKGEESFHGKY